MGPVETAINNECTDKRPERHTLTKSHNTENKQVTSSSVTSFVIRGIQHCSCTKITMKSSKGSLFCHKIIEHLF